MSGCGEKSFTSIGEEATMMNTQVSGSLDLHGMWTLCDYERANVEYACALSNHQLDENISRTCHIRTVSRSCEYACGFCKC